MSAAEREAERRMHERREQVGLTVVEQTRFIEGFEQGAVWQAERDAVQIAELEAEVEGIKRRDAEVGEDEGWWVGGAWGDYGEVVVPLRILSYVVDGKLDEKVTSIDPGFALTYAEQTARAEAAEAKLAEVRAVFTDTSLSSVAMIERLGLLVFDGDDET